MRRGPADTSVARLAVRADRADPLAARLCLERLLGAIDLRPDALPPSAVLCVRELRDPWPGRLSLASHQLGPPPAWAQAVRREVDRLARTAARPAYGAVPPAAEAVVFADHGELLACLGSDLVAGLVGARWWWPLLVAGIASPQRAVVRAWLRAPEYAPAALHALADRREAAAFVRLLDDRDTRTLAAAVGRAFGLPALDEGAGGVRGSARSLAPLASPQAPVAFAAAPVAELTEPTAVVPRVAPWSAVAPEADGGGLSSEQRALLGAALALVRAPALARSAAFAIDLVAWRAAAVASPGRRASPSGQRAALAGPRSSSMVRSSIARPPGADGPAPSAARERPAAVRLAADETPARTRPAASRAASTAAFEPAAAASGQPPDAGGPRGAQASSPDAPLPRDAAPIAELPDAAPAPPEPPGWSPAAPRTPSGPSRRGRVFGSPIHTRIGGVFYLVNLALYLRLYGDHENLPLPLWDFVALVGRALLGDGVAVDDPLWALLAELAGRAADEPPGADFTPPADWRIPRAWLTPFTPGRVQHRAVGGRLAVSHAQGFAIVDVPAIADYAAQLAAELAPYAGAIGSGDAAPLALTADRDRSTAASLDAPADTPPGWLARLVAYLRARLRLALGVADHELPGRLLLHRARIHATASRVDVVLALDTLPIEVRFAGLDRDPGWVPAAGRFLAFHFE
jgi:hypothetical protein